ncbi:hypothetical protein Tco_0832370 [Tanacetum coccineum]
MAKTLIRPTPAVHFYNAMLWNIDDPAFVKPGKLKLMRSVLAEDYEFFVPRDFRSSVVTKSGKGCSLKVTVNWKLPNSPAPSSNSSVSRLVKTERSKFGAHSTSIMAELIVKKMVLYCNRQNVINGAFKKKLPRPVLDGLCTCSLHANLPLRRHLCLP